MKKEDLKEYDLTPLLTIPPREGVVAAVILDIRKDKAKDFYPAKIRVTFNRRQVYYPCMDLTLNEYDKLHGLVKSKNLIKTKEIIQATFDRITDIIDDLIKHDGFTLEGLARRLKGGSSDSVITAFDNKIAKLQKKGKIGTSVWYSCARNSIKKYKTKDLKFSDVTPGWLEDYEAHLLEEGKEYTTISINMRALRAIINGGLKEGIITHAQYPFEVKKNGKYPIPEGSGRKIALNETQLFAVFDYPILPENEKWRDLWVFSFYCNGANISDILRFKYQNREGNYLIWYRQKTLSTNREKGKIKAKITPEMEEIMSRWGNPDKSPSNYIFPYLSPGLSPTKERMVIQNVCHTINKKMTAIGKALDIGKITTYWARHTWASISRTKDVSLYGISKGLGHKNLTTTQIYLDSLSDEEINENAAKMPRRNNGSETTNN